MRQEYPAPDDPSFTFTEGDLAVDWPTQFGAWFAQAQAAGQVEPNAMVLATATPDGVPSARTVLLKGYDADGFVFFTNYDSRKGREALANPYASLVFPWLSLHRQVVVCGRVEQVSREETREYFEVRPRGARLGAWASPQSQVITSRDVLERNWADAAARWPDSADIPAPDHWGGFRVVPDSVEFWQGRQSRLHDRLRFRRDGDTWITERLAP